MNYDTIAAVATAMTSSGIGIIRISGSDAFSILNKIFRPKKEEKNMLDQPTYTIHYGSVYDEEELLSDIEKKRNEREMKERTFVYAGDTFHLPARIKQIDSTKFIGSPGEPSYKYSFNASDKEAIMQSLFKHTSELSEYGNFELSQEQNFMRTTPPLSEVKIEVSDDATHWYFVDTNSSKICSISFIVVVPFATNPAIIIAAPALKSVATTSHPFNLVGPMIVAV